MKKEHTQKHMYRKVGIRWPVHSEAGALKLSQFINTLNKISGFIVYNLKKDACLVVDLYRV